LLASKSGKKGRVEFSLPYLDGISTRVLTISGVVLYNDLQVRSISNNQIRNRLVRGKNTLKGYGKRVTSQRALILEIIQRGKGHLDADEIYRRARAIQPRLSLSTVYRTLKALKEPGLIQELHLDDSHHHYEMTSASKHHHLVCLGCGKIIEFEYPISRHIKRNIPEARDFLIVDTEIRLTGYCPQCLRQREKFLR
jgi:Fur family ferric uptake transcriptional regulator